MNTDLVAQHALTHLAKAGADRLTENERIVATVWLFAAGVSNSGFSGYFRSSRADLAYYAPDALAAIGATRFSEIAAKANAIFGPKGPPTNLPLRRECMRALDSETRHQLTVLDDRYFECDEDVDELLERYLSMHAVPA